MRTTVEDSILGFLLPPGGIIWKGTSEGRLKWVSSKDWGRISRVRAGNKSLSLHQPLSYFRSSQQDLLFFSSSTLLPEEPTSLGLWAQEALGLSFPNGSCVARAQEDLSRG